MTRGRAGMAAYSAYFRLGETHPMQANPPPIFRARPDSPRDEGRAAAPPEAAPRLPGGVSVLLVDDHPEELRLLGELLHRLGARVLLATDGEEALRLAAELRPSLILLDVALPPTSGFTVCATLKQNPATAGIPVLFLSGHTEPNTKLRGFAAGGQDYITKPFSEAEVLARVALHIDLARRLKAADADAPRPGDAPAWLTAAVAILQANLAATPKLAALAHRVGANPRRLNEAFRTHLGQTVFGYLREARLKEAHRLLCDTALPISEVGYRVGYPLAANFATAFRERYGVSPRQLRREPDAGSP